MWAVRAIGIFLVIALVAGFFVYNYSMDQPVAVNLYWKQYENVPLLVVIFWSFLAGMALSLVLFVGVYLRQLTQISSARKAVKGLNEEVSALRNRPIEESRDMFGDEDNARPVKTGHETGVGDAG